MILLLENGGNIFCSCVMLQVTNMVQLRAHSTTNFNLLQTYYEIYEPTYTVVVNFLGFFSIFVPSVCSC